ncbi:hypothetical protein ACFO4E_04140 [Nocardiopsis mangrovi]|uniref:Uncharacterized protein n=1 Tax=Nocardiopsis mangrovi TaxID=1179818 RepID=A0ABV9DQI9_9ACTN
MSQPEPLPYQVSRSEIYNETAARTARITIVPDEQDPEVIIIESSCPCCTHYTYFREPVVVYRDMDFFPTMNSLFDKALRRAARDITSRDVEVICDCSWSHPGTPELKTGCGASWVLHIDWGSE